TFLGTFLLALVAGGQSKDRKRQYMLQGLKAYQTFVLCPLPFKNCTSKCTMSEVGSTKYKGPSTTPRHRITFLGTFLLALVAGGQSKDRKRQYMLQGLKAYRTFVLCPLPFKNCTSKCTMSEVGSTKCKGPSTTPRHRITFLGTFLLALVASGQSKDRKGQYILPG
ncbi:hypothetical protein CLV84_4074, partial [Neolewinella xylanilytica]